MQLQNKIKTIRQAFGGTQLGSETFSRQDATDSNDTFEIPEEYLQQFRAVLKSLPVNIPQSELSTSGAMLIAPNPSPASSASSISPPQGESMLLNMPHRHGRSGTPAQPVSDGKRWDSGQEDPNAATTRMIEALLWSPTETESPLDEGYKIRSISVRGKKTKALCAKGCFVAFKPRR